MLLLFVLPSASDRPDASEVTYTVSVVQCLIVIVFITFLRPRYPISAPGGSEQNSDAATDASLGSVCWQLLFLHGADASFFEWRYMLRRLSDISGWEPRGQPQPPVRVRSLTH